MSFTEVSNKITQTGTDTDLSGLNGVTGVTTTVRGNHTTYTIASTHFLEVQGTLSIDPAYETLQMMKQAINAGSGHPLTVTGTLNLGVKTTANGKDKYSVGVGIDLPNENLTGQMYNTFGISFGGSSTFLWNGGIIRTTATLRTANGATVTVNSGIFYNLAKQGSSNTNTSQFRIESSNSTSDAKINIYDLTFDGETLESRIFTKSGWNVGIFKFKKGGFQSYNSPFPPLTFENFDTSPNLHDFDIINVTRTQSSGETITIKGFSDRLRVALDAGRNNFMYLKCVRPISLVVEDLNGNPLTYSYYAKDLDSGNRALGPKNQDDRSDKIYNGVNQTSNLDEDVLVEVINYINKTITTDSRTNSNSEIPFSIIAYNQTITGFAEDLVGLDTLQSTVKMTPDFIITENSKTTVDAYTSIDTPQKFYDIAKSYLVDNYAGEASPLVSRGGNTIDAGSYDLLIDSNASSAFVRDGTTITIKASTFVGNLTTTGVITLTGSNVQGRYTDANGTNIVLEYAVSNIEAGSTLQIYNVTKSQEVINQVISATSTNGTYTTSQIEAGDNIRIRLTCQAGSSAFLPYEAFGVATSAGISFIADQQEDTVYNDNGIDGSSVTTLTADYPNVQIDISDGDGVADSRELYAFAVYQSTTSTGIENWFGAITAINAMNYRINVSNADIKLQNTGSNPLVISGARIFRSDGTSVLHADAGDKPMTQDTGELLQYIKPQVDLAINENTKLDGVSKNTKIIPALL
jgi:hypothetical protein